MAAVRRSGSWWRISCTTRRETALVRAGHVVSLGASWEGLVLETLLGAAANRVRSSFYRTAAGAEVDLILEAPGGELWAIEIRRSHVPKPERGWHNARLDLEGARFFVVYPGEERYPVGRGVDAISVRRMASLLSELR
jgi:predicted AAA+ superfamily ATPase